MQDFEAMRGTWGTYANPFNSNVLHPEDDFQAFRMIGNSVFFCSDVVDGWLVIHDYSNTFRVKPQYYLPKPDLPFTFRSVVKIKKHPEKNAKVINIVWHGKENKPMFFLEVDGKEKSRRYFAEELEQP